MAETTTVKQAYSEYLQKLDRNYNDYQKQTILPQITTANVILINEAGRFYTFPY